MNTTEALNLTSSQQLTFDKFKLKIADVIQSHHDDHYLVKWLKARQWNINKAEKMFRENDEWRKQQKVDEILTTYEPLEILAKYYPGGHFGHTKEGIPIWIEALATADQKGFYQSVTRKEIMKQKLYEAEYMFKVICPELSKKFGKRIDKAVEIVDLEGIGLKSLWRPAVETYGEMLAMAEAHYPDALYTGYVVNAPSIFPVAYSLIKPFLSEETRSKIKILGSNWKEQLLKDIDADQLPLHWGGTATDPDGDPYCRSKICMGGPIPEKYYRMKMLTENNDLNKYTTAIVQSGSSLELDYEVTIKDCVLSWNFFTDDKDIGFGVYRRKTPDSKSEEKDVDHVVPTERVNSHVIPESGRIPCETLGTYVVRFDNSYSWVNSKQLYYLIEVFVPDAGTELQRLDSTDF